MVRSRTKPIRRRRRRAGCRGRDEPTANDKDATGINRLVWHRVLTGNYQPLGSMEIAAKSRRIARWGGWVAPISENRESQGATKVLRDGAGGAPNFDAWIPWITVSTFSYFSDLVPSWRVQEAASTALRRHPWRRPTGIGGRRYESRSNRGRLLCSKLRVERRNGSTPWRCRWPQMVHA